MESLGMGYSTFAQHENTPLDERKIDRSFVHGAATNATLGAIYGASLALGKVLNMEVVAEGVEDRADWDFLRETGCDMAQGYFIAKPMPADGLVPWQVDWKKRLVSESLPGG